jgi:hypothetical protein
MVARLVTGNLNDITQTPMYPRNVRLWWQLNAPATTLDRVTVSAARVYAQMRDTGTWTIEVTPTELMMQPDRWYTVGWEWLDDGENFLTYEEYPAKIRVPDRDMYWSDLAEGFAYPLNVAISETRPTDGSPWWFQPSTNNLYHL